MTFGSLFGHFPVTLGTLWERFCGILAVPGCSRLFWVLSCYSGLFWTSLDHLGPSGLFWADLSRSGPMKRIWVDLDGFGPIWADLGRVGLIWADLHGFELISTIGG